MRDALVVGLTATGRVTVQVLAMNADERAELRRELPDEPPFLHH